MEGGDSTLEYYSLDYINSVYSCLFILIHIADVNLKSTRDASLTFGDYRNRLALELFNNLLAISQDCLCIFKVVEVRGLDMDIQCCSCILYNMLDVAFINL